MEGFLFLIIVGDFVSRRSLGAKEERRGIYSGVFHFHSKSESNSSFDIIAVCGIFYSVLEEDLCRKRSQ